MIIRRLATALRQQDWTTVIVEFLLVVLGVLLALQVENWNQQRKGRILLEDYLVQLQADLRDDIRRANRRVETTRYLDEQAQYFRSVIDGSASEPIDNDRLVEAILTAGYANLNLINSQTYDELVSTGNLRLFLDADLKRQVVSYYSAGETVAQWNPLIQSVQIDYRRAIRNLLNADQYRWARESYRDGRSGAPPIDMLRFRKTVKENDDLLGVLDAMAEIQLRIRRDSEETAKYAGQLLERLESAAERAE